jgi:hypothetical protein
MLLRGILLLALLPLPPVLAHGVAEWYKSGDEASRRADQCVRRAHGSQPGSLDPCADVTSRNVARGLTVAGKIPIVHATFALFPSKNLVKAQKAYRLINDLKIVLPIVTLVLLGLGVFIARRPRRALIGAGLGFAASMLVLAAGLLIARNLYLSSVPAGTLSPDAAAAAFDILVRFIRTALRTLLVVGLVVAVGAFFTGPSAAAVRTRHALSAGLGRLRHGGESGPASRWTYAHRHALRIGAVALAALIFVFWGQPTAAVVIVIAVLLLVVLALIEVIGRPPAQPAPAPPAPDQ